MLSMVRRVGFWGKVIDVVDICGELALFFGPGLCLIGAGIAGLTNQNRLCWSLVIATGVLHAFRFLSDEQAP